MSSDAERRAHPRAPLEVEAWVARDGARLHATTKDISIGGVGLAARAEWTAGDEVEVVLDLPAADRLTLRAKVAWRREDWVGVRFVAITAEEEALIQRTVNGALGLEAGAGGGDDDAGEGDVVIDDDPDLMSLLEDDTGEFTVDD